MKATMYVLLLILASNLCAQTERTLAPLLPGSPPNPRGSSNTISARDLRIPPKAIQELRRSEDAMKSGDTRSSARHLERALQIYPDYLEAHNNLGARYFELEEYEKAAAEFQKAIAIDPRVMAPFNNLSVAFFLLQRYADAEAAARQALGLEPRHITASYVLGAVLTAENRNPEEAMELLHQSEFAFPDARLLLAQILLRRSALEEAKQELRGYLALPDAPKRQNVERWLARLTQKSAANERGERKAP